MPFSKSPVKCEVINDLNHELVNFYRVASLYYPNLKQEIEATREHHRCPKYCVNGNSDSIYMDHFFQDLSWLTAKMCTFTHRFFLFA